MEYAPSWYVTPPPEPVALARDDIVLSPVDAVNLDHQKPRLALSVSLARPVLTHLCELKSHHLTAVDGYLLLHGRGAPLVEPLLDCVGEPLSAFAPRNTHDILLPRRGSPVIPEEMPRILWEMAHPAFFVSHDHRLAR